MIDLIISKTEDMIGKLNALTLKTRLKAFQAQT
jgi:hypothetical protein